MFDILEIQILHYFILSQKIKRWYCVAQQTKQCYKPIDILVLISIKVKYVLTDI